MSWEDIMKKNPMRSRSNAEKKKRRENKKTLERLKGDLSFDKELLQQLIRRRDEPNRRKSQYGVKSTHRYLDSDGREKERSKTEAEMKKERADNIKEYQAFLDKMNSKIRPLEKEIKETESQIKELEG
tara:strand:- start:290 stop:673 length:384 start_codon:yes stop_codon:yes gene_type:complete